MASTAAAAAATRMKVMRRIAAVVIVPTIPILAWWQSAKSQRSEWEEQVRTKVRVPNVQTVDDLLVESCKPGDVLVFDRRCDKCAAGPMAAMACVLGQGVLCKDDKTTTMTVESGKFDHCGIVVPGYQKNKADAFDPMNLLLLETTASEGIVARPLITRLEMSQSRCVMLLPLHVPGDNRNDEDYEPPEKTQRMHDYLDRQLSEFRDKWVDQSKKQGYAGAHSTLSIIGALGYALNLQDVSRAPVSPAAWVVLSALQSAGVGENLTDRTALETKVEDFLRDHRFHEDDTVRLRPGFKFMPPVAMREMSRS